MDDLKRINQRHETVTWGALFIFIGFLMLVPGVLPGLGTLGIGIILLSLCLVRFIKKMPMNGFTLSLGVTSLILGGVVLFGSLQGRELEGPFIPALLIAAGAYWVVQGGRSGKSE
jgi:hypothetical protein